MWSRHLQGRLTGTAARLVPSIDIVENTVGIARDGGSVPIDSRLRQGVLDTLLENEFSAGGDGLNAFVEFESRAADGRTWSSLSPGSGVLDGLPMSDASRIREVLGRGHRVVAADTPFILDGKPFAMWWHVDPSDGSTLGRGYRGWGHQAEEDMETRVLMNAASRSAIREYNYFQLCLLADAGSELYIELALALWMPGDPLPRQEWLDMYDLVIEDFLCG